MKAVRYIVGHFEEGLGILLLSVVVILICFNIFMRYLTGISYASIYELTALLNIWIAFIGATYAQKRSRQLCVDTLVRYLPTEMQKAISYMIDGAQIIFFTLLSIFAIILTIQDFPWESPTMGISMSWYSSPLAIGAILMLFYTTVILARRLGFVSQDEQKDSTGRL